MNSDKLYASAPKSAGLPDYAEYFTPPYRGVKIVTEYSYPDNRIVLIPSGE